MKKETNEAKVYSVRANCSIKIGDKCTVHYPSHHDCESEVFHRCCHGQSAEIVDLHEDGVDIKILSGQMAGQIVTNILPMVLFFEGPFILH